MNYQVKKTFIDRDSLKQFSAGDTFPCADAARAKILQTKGYLFEASPEEAAPDPKPQPKKAAKRSTKKKA